MRVLWLVLLAFAASAAQAAESLRVRVVSVTDGDTVTVITPAKKKMKVRLGGIDAPDKKQPFGKAAMVALSDLVKGRDVDLIGMAGIHAGERVACHAGHGIGINVWQTLAPLAGEVEANRVGGAHLHTLAAAAAGVIEGPLGSGTGRAEEDLVYQRQRQG